MDILGKYNSLRILFSLIGLMFDTIFGPIVGATMGPLLLVYIFLLKSDPKKVFLHPESKLSKYCIKYYDNILKYKEDCFAINCMLFGGLIIPILFSIIMLLYRYNILSIKAEIIIFVLYTCIRVGPYSQHFAYIHTMIHKEGHLSRNASFFKKESIFNNPALNCIFNFWIGIFYGVLPGTYVYGHNTIHHKFNNNQLDVICSTWGARDSVINYFAYRTQWLIYHVNITITLLLYNKGYMHYVYRMLLLTVYYWSFFGLITYIGGIKFSLIYLIYPITEGIIFLSSVNWSWHLFLDPINTDNEYVYSVTFFDEPSNVLNENYHVVHHQYPGFHWTQYPKLFKKHENEYYKYNASVFNNIHAIQLAFLAVTQQYTKIAKAYDSKYFIDKKLSLKETAELMKIRVRTTFFNYKQKQKEYYKLIN